MMIKIVFPFAALLILFIDADFTHQGRSYHFDGNGISREVLENYLDRSITMAFFLVPSNPEGKRAYPYHEDDVRMIKDTHAKFIGRAIYRWGGESLLNDPEFWRKANSIIDTLHRVDREIIFQGCLFEIITEDVGQVKIPSWAFTGYNLPVEHRAFSYQSMLNEKGKFVDHWRKSARHQLPELKLTNFSL